MSRLRGVGWSLVLVLCLVLGSAPGSTGAETADTSQTGSVAAVAPIKTDAPNAIHAAGRGGPWINMKDGRPLQARFPGASLAAERIQKGSARPLALASADFDEDGVPDVVASYATIEGGYITLHRGNVDAIYPNAPEAKARRTAGQFIEAPFLPDAQAFEVMESPDFIAAGDFDADGHWDLVTAERGGEALMFHPGDGNGGFIEPKSIDLSGRVTAMTGGEINRRDGLTDLVVGVEGQTGAQALIFEGPTGALHHAPEAIALPAPAIDLVLERLEDRPYTDLAIATARDVVVVRGRDRRLSHSKERQALVAAAVVGRFTMPFTIAAMAGGDFDGDHEIDLALLDEGGSLHFAARDELQDLAAGKGRPPQKTPLDFESLAAPSVAGPRATHLQRARISTVPGDDLLLVHRSGRRIDIRLPREIHTGPSSTQEHGSRPAWVPFEVEGKPVALLPMRLNGDAMSDLVVLSDGAESLSIVGTDAFTVFVVSNTNASGAGSLHQAITDANGAPGGDAITFNIPGAGPHTIQDPAGLPTISESVVIDGTTQPGFAGLPIVEIDASVSPDPPGLALHVTGANVTIRGLVINGAGGRGIILSTADNAIVEGNFLGTDVTGTSAAPNLFGGILSISSMNITIGGTTAAARNLISGNGPATGVRLSSSPGAVVRGNLIGSDLTGLAPLPNGAGIGCADTINTTIGGTTAGSANLISGNTLSGIDIWGDPSGVLVQGNFIGTDAPGTGALANGNWGIVIHASDNTIGGTSAAARNLISGNGAGGIWIDTGGAPGRNDIKGNYIGVDVSGSTGLRNFGDGIQVRDSSDTLIGGTTAAARNIISDSSLNGIFVRQSSFDIGIFANYIGTTAAGDAPLGNDSCGVKINSSTNVRVGDSGEMANVISGNATGICIINPDAIGNMVNVNLIGTDATGTLALGNTGAGIWTFNVGSNQIGTLTGQGNVISGNGGAGALIESSNGVTLQGNFIGLDVDGIGALPNGGSGVHVDSGSSNIIGGSIPEAGNTISSNTQHGIFLDTTTLNEVQNNFVGLRKDGDVARPNAMSGILIQSGSANLIGGTASSQGNTISGNTSDGVLIEGSNLNTVRGNTIGMNPTGTIALGNGGAGIRLSMNSSSNNIGGGSATGNLIAFNGLDGIRAESGVSNSIRSNSMFSNGGLGIDLQADGVTPNDALDPDVGPNALQNFPVLSNVATTGGLVTFDVALNSIPSSMFSLDFYRDPVCDPSGHGEGRTYLASLGFPTNAAGDGFQAGILFPTSIAAGEFLTATATGSSGNTSELSTCITATGVAPLSIESVGWDLSVGPRIMWDESPGADFYNIYVGGTANLAHLIDSNPDSCQQTTVQGATFLDIPVTQTPPLGQALWWIIRPQNQFGEGDAGDGSSGPRTHVNTGACGLSCAHDKGVEGVTLESACDPCVSMICEVDSFCCNNSWDATCVQEVRTICGSLTTAESQGACQHPACTTGVALQTNCDDPPVIPSCVKEICAVDSFCCTNTWDDLCVSEVATVCNKSCL